MKFRSEIEINSFPFNINFENRILFIGSCFSDNIGRFFLENRFNALVNPFGTLFNPFSIATALKMALNPSLFNEEYLVEHDGLWHSFVHHGRFSNPDKQSLIQSVQKQLEETRDFLLQTDYLFITFGTSYCYRYLEKNFIVSNCHKIPATKFRKERLEIDEIVSTFHALLCELRTQNPKVKVLFTVSPVRHLGDGFHENQVSKSILHLAIDKLLDDNNFYFPSYELFMDDLRDYRFYNQDLCHPSEVGIAYLKEKIIAAFFTEETEKKRQGIEKENKLAAHRPLLNK